MVVHIQGKTENINQFIASLETQKPRASDIYKIEKDIFETEAYKEFSIKKSKVTSDEITQVSPDIAVCDACLEDLKNQPHRLDYPFTNCTNCGPRFSIIENIPYDRPLTSMKNFIMCETCAMEYKSILDRRFHAQPVACNKCGPSYTLFQSEQKPITEIKAILNRLSEIIENSGIVAIRGLGGYHLACNAFNAVALKKLRSVKERDGKPFAIMFKNIAIARKYAQISEVEEEALLSWQRPIVLVKSQIRFPSELANHLTTLGIFLPYLPFHFQLFDAIESEALVMTSGNISDCPIIIDNKEALNVFSSKVDAILQHNREIVNRVDDSVVQIIDKRPRLIRRSRGFAPAPVRLKLNMEGIFATGAELSNTFGIGKGQQAILSQHIGDLKNLETMEFFEQSLHRFKKLFEFTPKHVVCDMHPEYLSTKFAEKLNIPLIKTQHHHAHVVSTMAEYGLDEQVIGVSYDGTGYGTDGKIWGSEIMLATLNDFERKYHFEYVPIPGGDSVAKEPWRSAVGYLKHSFEHQLPKEIAFLKNIDQQKLNLITLALEKGINTPESCSAGRLFDAVSALIGICSHATYHAEAPILLEHSVAQQVKTTYPIKLSSTISWKDTIKSIVNDLNNNVSTPIISAKFHNSVIAVTFEAVKKIHSETGINTVVLSGGSFQNKYLSENLLDLLLQTGYQVYMSSQVPVNDGGIALGQLAIAAKKLTLCV